ncbi:DUF3703 domain-containing protein [Rhodoferax bucti]|uniref:DUF3703 domain-containing protein n=1 Tax=Rhodoferax bucti TaxID=2576305 RepID=UPI0011083AE8|nr:DUF3703 domain-containing protein [Rhodoferax bucti]
MPIPANSNFYSPDIYSHLVQRYRGTDSAQDRQRWLILEAAHVVGQTRFLPHLKVHTLMLLLAWEKRMPKEVLGQLFRLALVPLGYLLKRLPIGNSGRADISAFKAMAPSTEILQVIAAAKSVNLSR